MVSELHVFDFDGTLFRSPLPPEWWSKKGWWGRPESLAPPVIPQYPGEEWWNTPVVELARESIADPDVMAVVMTGRVAAVFPSRINELLAQQDLTFDAVRLSPGGAGTLTVKARAIADIVAMHPGIEIVRVWDDRSQHMRAFETAATKAGARFDGNVVTRVSLPAACGPEAFMEVVFREGRALTEAYMTSDFTYKYARPPGFGFSTGMSGGTANTKPHRGGSQSSHLTTNPVKPYSDEFISKLDDDRQSAWESSEARFRDGIRRLKRDLSVAGSEQDIADVLADLNGGGWDAAEDIVRDHGTYMSLLRSGEIPKAKIMLANEIDAWANAVVARREEMGRDHVGLDDATYSPSMSYSQGRGRRSWS